MGLGFGYFGFLVTLCLCLLLDFAICELFVFDLDCFGFMARFMFRFFWVCV